MTNTTQSPTLTERKSSIQQAAYSLQKLLESKITKPYSQWTKGGEVNKFRVELYDLNSIERYPAFEEMPNGHLCFGIFVMFYNEPSSDNKSPITYFTYKTAVAIRYNNEFANEFRFFNVEDDATDRTSDWKNDMNKFVDNILEKMKDEISLDTSFFKKKPFDNGFLID
jgi:hypothetical protein